MSWAWLTMDQGDLPSAPQALWTTNVHEMAAADATLAFKAAVSFTTLRDSRINAFTTWFVAEFDGKVTLTNAPTAPMTHWGRYLFPLRGPLQLEKRDTHRGAVRLHPRRARLFHLRVVCPYRRQRVGAPRLITNNVRAGTPGSLHSG